MTDRRDRPLTVAAVLQPVPLADQQGRVGRLVRPVRRCGQAGREPGVLVDHSAEPKRRRGKSRLAQEFAALLPGRWSARTVRIARTGAALLAVPGARPLALILDDALFLDPAAVEALPGLFNEFESEAVLWR